MNQQCCMDGGALKLRCQLCPNSPTYYRRCPDCGQLMVHDPATNELTHPGECEPAERGQNGGQP